MSKRYHVDERGGIVAVRDFFIKNDSQGLHADYPDVVASWMGVYNDTEFHWDISEWKIEKANLLCHMLNELHELKEKNKPRLKDILNKNGTVFAFEGDLNTEEHKNLKYLVTNDCSLVEINSGVLSFPDERLENLPVVIENKS